MKIHCFVSGLKSATMDLDKKLPLLVKTYLDGKVEKTSYNEIPCIKGTNIVKDVKINKFPRGRQKPSDHTPIEIELA